MCINKLVYGGGGLILVHYIEDGASVGLDMSSKNTHPNSIVSCKPFEYSSLTESEMLLVKQKLTAVLKPYFPLPSAAYSYTF